MWSDSILSNIFMTNISVKFDLETVTSTASELNWHAILFNCNCHTFDTVIELIMIAISCSTEKASQLANVADRLGSVTIFTGSKERCEQVADILGGGGLLVKVAQ